MRVRVRVTVRVRVRVRVRGGGRGSGAPRQLAVRLYLLWLYLLWLYLLWLYLLWLYLLWLYLLWLYLLWLYLLWRWHPPRARMAKLLRCITVTLPSHSLTLPLRYRYSGILLLALRMAKPLKGGLAEEDSAELAISTTISACVLSLSAYDHSARQGALRWGAAEEHATDVGVTGLVLQARRYMHLLRLHLLQLLLLVQHPKGPYALHTHARTHTHTHTRCIHTYRRCSRHHCSSSHS